jgi:hypothetical protein
LGRNAQYLEAELAALADLPNFFLVAAANIWRTVCSLERRSKKIKGFSFPLQMLEQLSACLGIALGRLMTTTLGSKEGVGVPAVQNHLFFLQKPS